MGDKKRNDRALRKAKQEFKDACNIVNVVRAYKGGQVVSGLRQPLQGDFTKPLDIRDVVTAGQRLKDAFMSHPAELRKRFGNDPGEMAAFVMDPKNRDEALKLGLLVPPPPPAPPLRVKVVPDEAPK